MGRGRRAFLYGASATAVAAFAGWQLWPAPAGSAAPVTTDAIGDQVQRLPRGQLPVFAGTAEIQRLYRYAVEHGDELQYVPCFCGCERFDHTSNRDCYIKAFDPDGTLTFTSHAAT
ncbi:MAG: PCYCGC motif-containing (lipo)protein [Candidatus Rokuibacteriota bacterium]